MYLRYSSIVVAPIVRSSPRASIGLSMFEASTEPSAAPAPTIVCSSSMNRMNWSCASVTSFKNAFRRSSNSPRNFAPELSCVVDHITSPSLFTSRTVAIASCFRSRMSEDSRSPAPALNPRPTPEELERGARPLVPTAPRRSALSDDWYRSV